MPPCQAVAHAPLGAKAEQCSIAAPSDFGGKQSCRRAVICRYSSTKGFGLGHDEQLPDTIQGLVLARTDQLPAKDREALQAASVIGQRFDLEALRAILEEERRMPDSRPDTP